MHVSRRRFLQGLSAVAAAGVAGGAARHARSEKPKPKHLIVVGAVGGASIIDSFLAIRESESPNAATINAFPDAAVKNVPGTAIRAVDTSGASVGVLPLSYDARQSNFVAKHKNDMMVVTMTGTSVNHVIAQKRSATGNGAFHGRTLQECVAKDYGKGYVLPNVNMGAQGFADRGDDLSLPAYAVAEPVAVPSLWPLSLDGRRGISGAPSRSLMEKARALRDDQLDPQSEFYKTFQLSERLQLWKQQRAYARGELETRDLITKLNIFTDQPPQIPLKEYGLGSSEDAELLQSKFPSFFTDPFESQAALAYLLLKNRVSVAVTLSTSFNFALSQTYDNLPLSFDYSHSAHRGAQAYMWQRILTTLDKLINLLKAVPFDDSGESFWDRTMIYVATDFGRGKTRQNGEPEFSSVHDLNNGYLVMSPFVNGNKVLGGVDEATGNTFGFDPHSGAPTPNKNMSEGQIFSGLASALDLDTTGASLPSMPVMRKGG